MQLSREKTHRSSRQPATVDNGTVTVTALENTETTAKTATLTLYIAASEGGEHLAEATVALTQAGVPSGESTITTFTFSEMGLANQDALSSYTNNGITITFAKASGSNPPKYYDSGNAARAYAKNTITISCESGSITNIEFPDIRKNKDDNNLTCDNGAISSDNKTWTGTASSVTFTVGGTNGGHVKITTINITHN